MIPEEFKKMMRPILGGEYGEFINALENSPAVRALRVNTLKISPADFEKNCKWDLEKVPHTENGYIFREEKVGSDPLHHAGAYYVQDPSAMATVEAARDYIKKDALILDLCAAPGGKSSQLAQAAPDGFLISNEYVFSRSKILRGNIERMGIKNCAVVSCDTAELSRQFPSLFDIVLCDAPCSGEGMMRKYNEEVFENWSLENIDLCALRQTEILENAAKCTADGGILVYSTCTFNLSENEMTVDAFLTRHDEFSIVGAGEKVIGATRDGLDFEGCRHSMKNCRRFYPHITDGEGQFICIMKKAGERENAPAVKVKSATLQPLTKEEFAAADRFFRDAMGGVPKGNNLGKIKDTVMLYPENSVCPDGAIFCGTAAGEVIKDRFQPHHHLFSAFGKSFLRKAELTSDSDDATKYLRGETIDTDAADGWCAVFIDGCPAGGGKAVGGVLKNHYPKGLRNR